MYGLQPVAYVGQRARYDDAHRVIEERLAHLAVDIDVEGVLEENSFLVIYSEYVAYFFKLLLTFLRLPIVESQT